MTVEPSTLINLPKTDRGMITLNRIIAAAENLFGKMGYYNTSISDVAKRAKVSAGTIYIYFPDKFSLYRYLLTQYGHRIRKEIAKGTRNLTDRLEIERKGLLIFLKMVRKKPHMYKIIWESLYIDGSLFKDYYESFAARYISQLETMRDQVTDMDHTVMSYALMGIANFIGLKYVFFDQDADLEHVADEVAKLLRHGMMAPDK